MRMKGDANGLPAIPHSRQTHSLISHTKSAIETRALFCAGFPNRSPRGLVPYEFNQHRRRRQSIRPAFTARNSPVVGGGIVPDNHGGAGLVTQCFNT